MGLTEVLGLEEALTRPWVEEQAGFVTHEELTRDFPETVDDPSLIDQAIELGVIEPMEGGYRLPSPRLYHVGLESVAAGYPLKAVLDEGATLKAEAEGMAMRFVDQFIRYVWQPAFSGDVGPAELAKLTETIQRMRPLGAESVQIFLAQAMDRVVSQAMTMPPPWATEGKAED